MNRTMTSLLVLACAAAVSCGGEKPPSPAPPAPGSAVTAPVAAPAAAAGGEIGIPECDEFIRKYETCVRDHVPAAQKQMSEQALQQWRQSWKMAASQPAARASLAASCQQTLATARMSMSAHGCQW